MNQPPESHKDYERIAEAIAYLQTHHRLQPGLMEVATHLGLSEFHAQKLFSRWAGISPKRFLQFLTVEYTKHRMAETADLLDLSLDAGLSGPSRLHDLFINMEAMSPGEFKHAAKGVVIRYGIGETPFGPALLATTARGISHLSFIQPGYEKQAIQKLFSDWPSAIFEHDTAASTEILLQIFNPKKEDHDKPLSLWVSGTNFQIQVWRALLQIPYSGLLNYQQIANRIGKPKGARPVGNAVAKNPIAFLIPCHRVLKLNGDFGQYHWGPERKTAIVAWEAAQQAQA
ncbi:MAG: methylated-DNA--[protein]-cysteine S-methyltransferase [Gammaproteobacteria bacterium]|nr:methylated-DNA--[protein]-cysteine S-methyltransferase [Gammaproteobacteria bacterium]